MNDPRQFYRTRLDAELATGDETAWERYQNAAALALRESEEWPRHPPRGATLEEMGWTEPIDRGEDQWGHRLFETRKYVGRKVRHICRISSAPLGLVGDWAQFIRRSLTGEVRKWEAL